MFQIVYICFFFVSGDLCAAKFVDDQWYRAKVEKVTPNDVSVLYVDYGNRATIAKTRVGTLPATFSSQAAYAKEYVLALVKLAPDVSYLTKLKLTFQIVCEAWQKLDKNLKNLS